MRVTDMTVGRPGRLIVGFALPMMAGNICQQLYTIVDGAFVGRIAGVDALDAIGAADWLCWLFMGVIVGYTQGFSVLISQRFGAQDLKGLRRAVGMSVTLTALIALFLSAATQLLVEPALRIMQTPAGTIYDQAAVYLRILFAGLPIYAAYNVQAGILRAVGDSKTPLTAMLLASLTNISLDALFVVHFRWGVRGAAGATLIAQAAAAGYCFLRLRRVSVVHLERRDLSWHGPTAKRLVALGSPTAAQNLVIGFGGMAVQRVINECGREFIAGFTATNKLYGLMEMAGTSYGAAVAAYTGQNYGARRPRRIQSGIRVSAWLSVVTSMMIAAALFLLGRHVLSIFVDPAEEKKELVLDVAETYLRFMLAALFVLYLLYVYRSALQGMGDTLTPMLSGMAELVMRVGTALILPQFMGRDGIYFAEPAAWLAAELLLMLTYFKTIRRITGAQTVTEES